MKKSQLTKIIKEEIASVIKEEEEFRSLLMELPDTMIDPTVDIAAGSFQAANSAARMYAKTGEEKYRKQGEQAIQMSKDTAEGQGIIADLVTMFVGAPAVAMGAKAAAKKALKKVANPVGPVQMAKFRAGRKLGNLKDRAKDVSSLAKVTKQMATGKGRALVKQAAKDLSGPTVKNQFKNITSPKGARELFDQMVWYSKGAKGVSPASKSRTYREIFSWDQVDPFFGGSSNPHAAKMIGLVRAQGSKSDDLGRAFLKTLDKVVKQ
tara:strand:- start:643 stop:1437 length:795 start_codon:yes stop_codon:yes gene_type:complete